MSERVAHERAGGTLTLLRPGVATAVRAAGGRGALAATLTVAASLLVWQRSLGDVDIRAVTDLGLASVLPPAFYIALGLVTISFCATLLLGPPRTWLAVLHVVALVVMAYGPTSVIAEVPSFNIAWRHAGITDYILGTGGVDPDIDAYFNWPGFFFLSALATDVAGLKNALGFVNWAPVVFNLLYLPPLVAIARAATADERLAWSAVWVFYLTNWVGQDYFSPQALSFFLYLALIAVLLRWFRETRAQEPARRAPRAIARLRGWAAHHDAGPRAEATPEQRVALLLACVAIIGVTAASHQLTPFAMLAGVGALVLLGLCAARGLATIAAVLILAWISYMTLAYLAGNLEQLHAQVGDVGGTLGRNVSGRVAGSPDHTLVVGIRIAMTGLLWAVAGIGILRALRAGRHLSVAALAVAPFLLVALNAYGGEVVLRIYMFSLPFVAFFVASLLPVARGGWRAVAALAVLSAVLLAGFTFTRYGNERLALFTHEDVRAVERLYRIAEPGAVLAAPSPNLPWQGERYATYKYQTLTKHLPPGPDPSEHPNAGLAGRLADYLASTESTAYLVVTRSTRSFDALFPARWGTVAGLERVLKASPRFRTLWAGRESAIYALTAPQPGVTR